MTPKNRNKRVVAHSIRPQAPLHEVETNRKLAHWLAQILDLPFAGSYDPALHGDSDLYLLPTQTLVGGPAARQLGVSGPEDLWGGYVEHDFICTKAITHGLLSHDAIAPQGWAPLFAERVRKVVLEGISVFSLDDALPAAEQLLERGPIRLKPIHACAGRGQEVIRNLDAFRQLLMRPEIAEQFTSGVVLEQDLSKVFTHSVGQSFIGDKVLSYCGDQYLTQDAHGEDVYGGSNLLVVRGYYDDLLGLDLPVDVRLAIEQAQVFDAAADEAYPGFYASRRNYDIAQGLDAQGQRCSGVLEQSWRLGGASSAELLALQAFADDPALQRDRASTHEVFGTPDLPTDATLFYQGIDSELGQFSKFARIREHDHSE